jgi:drug/metabolite transporter (DMT)-like permease
MITTIRLYYDAVIAIALMVVVAAICGFIGALILGDSPPNFTAAAIGFVLTGVVLVVRLWRTQARSSMAATTPEA